jgi:hypothetical protein
VSEVLQPGLHKNVPPHVYHTRRIGTVSKSALDHVRRSPAHYLQWVRGAEVETTPALAFGSAFHCALLEPERFERDYAAEPDFGDCRYKDNKAKRDAWREAHAGATPVAIDDDKAIRAMIAAVRAHPLAKRMIQDGEAELTAAWNDVETGLPCKCRADYYVERLGMVVDVKTTLDARSNPFGRSAFDHAYHVQDALYRAGFSSVGKRIDHFVFMAIEKTAPYAIATYSLDARGIGIGHSTARRDIERLADCIKRNDWPAYDVGIQELSLPPWAA